MVKVEKRDLKLRASPRARALAASHGVSLAGLRGSGPAGRIIERDVKAAATRAPREAPEWLAARSIKSGEESVTAKLEAASPSTGSQLVLSNFADASELETLNARMKDSPPELGLREITIDDMMLFAVSRALLRHSELNLRITSGAVERLDSVDLGFTVDSPRGLFVPVIKGADRLSLRALSCEGSRLAQCCREGTASPEDLSGATFTVTSFGATGVETLVPSLAATQAAVLGVGAVALKPIRRSGGVVEHVPHVRMSLALNRQIVDGAAGAHFLHTLAGMLARIRLLMAE